MSENYHPDDGAEPQGSYATGLLSQRDLSLQIPINFVTSPGVSVSAACFANGKHEDDSEAVCLSNLLAIGFRRFALDLYWDQVRQLWSFCPVAILTSIPDASPSSVSTASHSSSSQAIEITSATLSQSLVGRQTTPTSSGGSTLSASSLGQTNPTISVLPTQSDAPVLDNGPYTCTTTINLSTFTSLLLDYIQNTQNTLEAQLLHVILNIHAASSASAPTSPAPAPAQANLPSPSDSLSALISSNLSSYLYTPINLRTERANINASWYTVEERHRPVEDYYSISLGPNDIASTEDGWPSESFIEFSRSKRLILGWGTVDPQMAEYNFTEDESIIFPRGYVSNIRMDINTTSAGQITNGCFLRNDTELLSQINSSWAADTTLLGFDYPTTLSSDITPLLNLTLNTTQCGISPILNTTLLNFTANSNYHPYQNYSYATIWSWAPNEPRNYSTNGDATLFRCATINPDLSNRWAVADCSQRYYAACRAPSQPYNWTITSYTISYSYADEACPSGYSFAAPRTALENSYLGQEMRRSKRDWDGRGPWVDFNSLDIAGCWTVGGPNATCPYSTTVEQIDDLRKRVILIPTIAAIIVLVVTGMTILNKIASGRKGRKRTRKRAENGFVYEGVPS